MKRIGLLHHPKLPATQPMAERMARAAEAHGLNTWIGSTWDEAAVAAQVADLDSLVALGGEGEPWTCTEDPACAEGDTLEALREELGHYQRALEWPVLEYADLVPDYNPSAPNIDEPF